MSQSILLLCCCQSTSQCPVEPCPPCDPSSLAMNVTANGTLTTTVASYEWSVTPRTSTIIEWAIQPGAKCRWDTRFDGGTVDLVITGDGSFAGEYVLLGFDFWPVLECEEGVTLRSRFVMRWSRLFGFNRFQFSPLGLGPYTECAAGFQVTDFDEGSGIIVFNATEEVTGTSVTQMELTFT